MHIVLFYDNNVLIFNTIMQYCVRPMSEYVPIYRSHKHVWRKNIEKLELNVLKRKWKGLFSSCSFLRLDWNFHSHSFSVSPGNFKIIETFLTAISRYWFWDNPFFLFFVLSMFMKFILVWVFVSNRRRSRRTAPTGSLYMQTPYPSSEGRISV